MSSWNLKGGLGAREERYKVKFAPSPKRRAFARVLQYAPATLPAGLSEGHEAGGETFDTLGTFFYITSIKM